MSITYYVEGNELVLQQYFAPKGDSNYRLKQLRFQYKLGGNVLTLRRGNQIDAWDRTDPATAEPHPWLDFPLARSEKDDRPAFRIDPSKYFRIELGRGDMLMGLDTIRISQNGFVVLHRRIERSSPITVGGAWEKTSLQLSPAVLSDVLETVEKQRLQELDRAYYANVSDGTQWVLWISQGDREKAVYFNNHFPASVKKFVARLDELLAEAGLDKAVWEPVPEDQPARPDRELQDSLDRARKPKAAAP